ncbi:myosin heavy chain-like protein isoform X2 [Tasmannia lanceolata]|uniref:myosin heavy chain-like protein isoform X2 n=1 Tax=Tasmannia lanceolata TaxID=3420 RepID=UPI0040635A2F
MGFHLFVLLPLHLFVFRSAFAQFEIKPTILHHPQAVCRDPDNDVISCQLEETKLKISRFESILEENTKNLNMKALDLEAKEKLTVDMAHKIEFLQNALLDIKQLVGGSSDLKERVEELEEEVRHLWDVSRKNNFKLHILEARASDAEDKLEAVASEVEQMENIVTEQWIQIRQLEQALQLTQVRMLRALRKAESDKFILLKFIKDFHGGHLQKIIGVLDANLFGDDFVLRPYLSQFSHQFKRIMSAAQKYHHEVSIPAK